MYPEYAEINGQKYKIDTSYKTALKCFEVINDETITDYERALAIIYLLFDFIPKDDINIFLKKVAIFLECNKKNDKTKNKKKDIDFQKDRGYINASFMSDYHLDITKEDIHFWLFIELIEGLKEDCILNRIRDIRNCNLQEITDEKTRNKIKEAKQYFSLEEDTKKPTKEQQESANEFYKQLGLGKE